METGSSRLAVTEELSLETTYGVIIHTHPSTTGPSHFDFEMLNVLGQRSSYIYELFGGGLIRFSK